MLLGSPCYSSTVQPPLPPSPVCSTSHPLGRSSLTSDGRVQRLSLGRTSGLYDWFASLEFQSHPTDNRFSPFFSTPFTIPGVTSSPANRVTTCNFTHKTGLEFGPNKFSYSTPSSPSLVLRPSLNVVFWGTESAPPASPVSGEGFHP